MQEILLDTKNGKVIDWRGRKFSVMELSGSFDRLGVHSKAFRVSQCGSFLEFKEYSDGSRKLYQADFCKVRLCPMCSWRRSLKIFGQVSKVMDYLTSNYDYKYLFVTLSVKNVYGESLSAEIDNLFKAFKKLTDKNKNFKAISNGWFRCLEVTHDTNEFITKKMYKERRRYYESRSLKVGSPNPNFNTYHPHFHVVVAVNPSYFTGSRSYLSQNDWVSIWQWCLGVDYLPIVDIRTVKPVVGTNDYGKGVAEIAKYAVKSSDYIVKDDDGDIIEPLTDESVFVFDKALANRRLVAFGGLFREVHKQLNLDDTENGDLINTDNEDDVRGDLNYMLVRFNWNIGAGNYLKGSSRLSDKRLVSDDGEILE